MCLPRFTRTSSPRSIFSEVELADEFTELAAVTPNGLLPYGAPAHRRTPAQGCPSHARRDRGGQRLSRSLADASSRSFTPPMSRLSATPTPTPSLRGSPFTPQPAITQALLTVAECPVFCRRGGGTTTGKRPCRWQPSPRWARRAAWSTPRYCRDGRAHHQHRRHPRHRHGRSLRRRCSRKGARRRQILNIAAGKNTPQVCASCASTISTCRIAPGGKTPESLRDHRRRR